MTDGLGFLAGGGAMGELVRRHDWAPTPLGAIEAWPQSLRTTIDIMLASGHGMCVMWGPERVFLYNDAYAPFLGSRHPGALGQPTRMVWAELWSDIGPLIERTFAGETLTFRDQLLVMTRHGFEEETWFDFSYSPVRGEDGKVAGLLNVTADSTPRVITERQRDAAIAELAAKEEQGRLLNQELGHRLKNLLAIVQAVATQTIRQSDDLATAGDALSFRLAALGRAADVLTAASWDAADMATLAHAAIDGQAGHTGRIRIDGPPIRFNAQVSLALTLALHELATNATKYGALSTGSGHVDLRWAVQAGDSDPEKQRFTLSWREAGGPRVEPPSRRGFGSLLIERSLRSYFRGSIAMKYDPSGLVFTIDAPLAHAIVEGNS